LTPESVWDEFAWLYDRYWAEPFQNWHFPAVAKLLLSRTRGGAHILDLCCGTGQLARTLTAKGYRVTGVDSSAQMLRHAARNAPNARLIQAKASHFRIPDPAEAAVCGFNSVNHLLSMAEVGEAFRCVHSALAPGSLFLCDVNTRDAYGSEWDETWSIVEPDHACYLRGFFDPASMLGTTMITMFRQTGDGWRRSDVELQQRCYSVEAVTKTLVEAGFHSIEQTTPEQLRLNGHYGIGRVFLLACAR
jgi:SAM-dependent methyltransferase